MTVNFFGQKTDCDITKLTSSKVDARHIMKTPKNEKKTSRGYWFQNISFKTCKSASKVQWVIETFVAVTSWLGYNYVDG